MKSPCANNRMTLEDLTKGEVYLILGVREGHGFGSLNCPLVVVAGLDGHRLETDIIPPSSDPLFAIELVWEADLKNIRRLRQANTPVKIECFSIINSQKRDRIGYILLNLKQAQIVPHGKKVNIIESWHRLLGVRSEMKALNPEMLLTLRIEDSPDPTPKPIKVNPFNDITIQNLPTASALTPLLFADEDVIQIGSQDLCNDLFKLKIRIGVSSNIKLLVPNIKSYCRQLHVSDGIDNVAISYSVLGYSLHSLINIAEINNRDTGINCKDEPVVKVRSNLKTLRLYFNEFPLLVFRLLANDLEFATTSLQLKGLIVTDSLQQFQKDKGKSIETRCYLTPAPKIELGSIKPYIDVSISLSYSLHEGDDSTIPGVPKTVNKYQNHEDNSMPENTAVLETILSPRKRSPQTITNRSPAPFDSDKRESNPAPIGDSDREIVSSHKNLSLPNSPKFFSSGTNHKGSYTYRCNNDFDTVSPHSYILFVTLSSINFKKLPLDGKFTFSMHHPAAEIVCSAHGKMSVEQINENICLPSIEVQFRFISKPDEINSVLMAEQPVISVCDSYNRVFASAVIETGILLSSQKNKECTFTASLESDSQVSSPNKHKKQQIGLLNISMELKDCGILIKPASNQGTDGENFLNMDKTVAYRVVEELEDWKERQQELFKNELKRKECQHLTMLSSEWTKRRIELEDNLNRNVEQCRNLAQSLNEATDNMRERSRKNSEKERALALAEKELERKYEMKFQELKEATNRMEADVNHKLSLMKFEKTELLERVGQMEREKKRLLINYQSLEKELETVRASGLSKEQAAGLLQEMKAIEEKLEAALESKMFFKEQWGKAVREIHRLKKEHQVSVQSQLQKEHEELRKLQLGQQAKEEEKQMFHDKNTLQDLKIEMQELAMHQQKQKQPSRMQEQLNHSAIHTSEFHSSRPYRDLNSAQLQRLIDQRDQLLNSGSTTNRELLAALNNQIRTLLLQMSA